MCVLQMEYFSQHPRGVNPVQLNDVMFSLHATAACIVTALQCFIYDVCRRFSFSLLTACLPHQSATVSIHTEPQKSLNMKLKTSSPESPRLGPWSWENLENSWRMRCVSPGKAGQGPFFLADFHAYTYIVWPRMTIIGVVTYVERRVFLGLIHASILRMQGPASLYSLSCLR